MSHFGHLSLALALSLRLQSLPKGLNGWACFLSASPLGKRGWFSFQRNCLLSIPGWPSNSITCFLHQDHEVHCFGWEPCWHHHCHPFWHLKNLPGRLLLTTLLLGPNRDSFKGTELPIHRRHQALILSVEKAAEMRRCSIPRGGLGGAHLTLKCQWGWHWDTHSPQVYVLSHPFIELFDAPCGNTPYFNHRSHPHQIKPAC